MEASRKLQILREIADFAIFNDILSQRERIIKGQREKTRVCFRYLGKHYYSHIICKARGKAIFSRFLEGLRGAFDRGKRNNEILQKSKKVGKSRNW